jgi:hypothetical protein
VTDPDIEKRRRRSLRGYVDFNRPVNPDAVALIDRFPHDEDGDGDDGDEAAVSIRAQGRGKVKPEALKRDVGAAEREHLASEGRAVRNPDGHVSYPVRSHEDAENALALIRSGHGDTAAARRMLRRVARKEGWQDIMDGLDGKTAEKQMGNAMPSPYGRSVTDRTSPPIEAGHAACSTGDHGAVDPMNVPGARALAMGHPNMRFSTTVAAPLATMRSVNGDNEFHDRDITHPTGTVNLSRLDLAGASGLSSASGNPAARWGDHQSRESATPPNGTHSLANPTSHAGGPGVMKNSELRAEIKRMLFPGSGGRR